ncbi:MAG TPA: STAS domain-containing protein [Acidimicrobiia bacterium]|nr:STAS domain-containing protein [Acidimicrobiia bacterium]
MTGAPHELHIEDGPNGTLARITGEIDQSNAAVIDAALREYGRKRPLAVDLSAAEYLDSAGIAMFEALRHDTALRLVVAPGSIVSRALAIAGLDQLVTTSQSADEIDFT